MRASKLSMSNSRNLRSSTLAFSTPGVVAGKVGQDAHHERQFDQPLGIVGVFVGDVNARCAVTADEFLTAVRSHGSPLAKSLRSRFAATQVTRAAQLRSANSLCPVSGAERKAGSIRFVGGLERALGQDVIQKAEKVSLCQIARAVDQKGNRAGRFCGPEKCGHFAQQAQAPGLYFLPKKQYLELRSRSRTRMGRQAPPSVRWAGRRTCLARY